MLGIRADFEKRIFGFDLLRAFAIFCVVHGHGRHLLKGTFLEGFPWIWLPHGVDIFFVLSGFLIGYSFIVSFEQKNNQSSRDKLVNFWKRSSLRILPNYYLILLVNYLLVQHEILNGNTEKFSIWLFATFTQNLFYPFYDFFLESWSLATQEWFYLLFPILFIVTTKFIKPRKAMLVLIIFFIALSPLYRLSISHLTYDNFWWDVSFRKVAASRIDCIFYGVLAAWFRFYYKARWSKLAATLFVAGIGMFIAVKLIPGDPNSFYSKVIYLSLPPIYIALTFPLLDKLKDVKNKFGRLITYFSILSYALYLFNLMIIQIIDRRLSTESISHGISFYFLYWLICIVLSYLLYILFENPIYTFGNNMLHTQKMMYKRLGAPAKKRNKE